MCTNSVNAFKKYLSNKFVSTDSFDFARRVLFVSKIFGVFPFDKEFNISRLYLFFTLVSFILLTCSLANSAYYTLFSADYYSKLSRYLDFSEALVGYTNVVASFLLLLSNRERFFDVLGCLHTIERKLCAFGEQPRYSLFTGVSHTIIRSAYIVVISFEPLYFPEEHKLANPLGSLLFNLSLQFTVMLVHLLMCPFFALMKLIDIQYGKLNLLLKRFNIGMDTGGRKKMEKLIIVGMELYESSCSLNGVYSLIIFITLSSSFFLITVNAYFICYLLIARKKFEGKPVNYYIFNCANSIILWFLELYNTTHLCVQIMRKSSYFQDEVYKSTLNDKYDHLGKSGKLQAQLAFKPIANFVACGFIPLNYSLIHGLLASATSYIVLLIQFENGR